MDIEDDESSDGHEDAAAKPTHLLHARGIVGHLMFDDGDDGDGDHEQDVHVDNRTSIVALGSYQRLRLQLQQRLLAAEPQRVEPVRRVVEPAGTIVGERPSQRCSIVVAVVAVAAGDTSPEDCNTTPFLCCLCPSLGFYSSNDSPNPNNKTLFSMNLYTNFCFNLSLFLPALLASITLSSNFSLYTTFFYNNIPLAFRYEIPNDYQFQELIGSP